MNRDGHASQSLAGIVKTVAIDVVVHDSGQKRLSSRTGSRTVEGETVEPAVNGVHVIDGANTYLRVVYPQHLNAMPGAGDARINNIDRQETRRVGHAIALGNTLIHQNRRTPQPARSCGESPSGV